MDVDSVNHWRSKNPLICIMISFDIIDDIAMGIDDLFSVSEYYGIIAIVTKLVLIGYLVYQIFVLQIYQIPYSAFILLFFKVISLAIIVYRMIDCSSKQTVTSHR